MTLLTGCGAEIAYKRGATGQDLQAGKNACQKTNTENELNKCLEGNGWAIQKLDGSGFSDDDLFATASVTKDNRMTAQKKKTIQTTESIATERISKTDDGTKEISETKTPQHSNRANMKKVKPKPSLLDNYVIKSWWKMGAGAALLEKNMHECSEKLGPAHTPNKKTFTFTRGFAICMRTQGWRGLIDK